MIQGPGVTYGSRPDIVIKFNNEKIVIPPMITLKAHVDSTSGKAIIFYEDSAALRFQHT